MFMNTVERDISNVINYRNHLTIIRWLFLSIYLVGFSLRAEIIETNWARQFGLGTLVGAIYSPQGDAILTYGNRGAFLWSVKDGSLLRELAGHNEIFWKAAFSPNAAYVVTGSNDKTAKLWSVGNGTLLRTFVGFEDYARCFAFSSDGTQVLAGNRNTVLLLSAEDGTVLRTFVGHSNFVNSVAFSPDGTQVLTGSSDQKAKLWSVKDGTLLRTFAGHSNDVTCVAFSPDGIQVLTGSNDKTTRLWSAKDGTPLRSFQGDWYVHSVAFSPDGTMALTGSYGKTTLWSVRDGTLLRTITTTQGWVENVAFSPDGEIVFTGSNNPNEYAKLWSVWNGTLLRSYAGHSDAVNCVDFSPDGKQVLTGGDGNSSILWSAGDGLILRIFGEMVPWLNINSVDFSPDGKEVLTGGGDPKLWSTGDGTLLRTFTGEDLVILSVAFSPDGKQVLTGSYDKTAKLWSAEDGTLLRTFTGHSGSVRSVTFSPDGTRVLTGGYEDKTAKIWSTGDGALLRTLVTDSVLSVAFSPDGKQVATGSYERANLWSAEDGTLLQALSIQRNTWVNSVSFSPDGTQLLTGSSDSMAHLWSVATGKLERTFAGHWGSVTSVAFSPDGTKLLTGSADGTALLWEVSQIPLIIVDPLSMDKQVGSDLMLTVKATGAAPLGYQWLFNGTYLSDGANISGAKTDRLMITNLNTNQAGRYSVVVSNNLGTVTSQSAAIAVLTPPIITLHPQHVLSVLQGDVATFQVKATGSGPLSYQWQLNGTNLNDGANISGTMMDILILNNVQQDQAGEYLVMVSNSVGTATSLPAWLIIPPAIVKQPNNVTVVQGNSSSFQITSTGTEPLCYQWSKNGIPISGAISSNLTLTNVQGADAGNYFVTITNLAGSIASDVAVLVVEGPDLGFEVWGGNYFPDEDVYVLYFEDPNRSGYTKLAQSAEGPTYVGDYRIYLISPTANNIRVDAIKGSDGGYISRLQSLYFGDTSGGRDEITGPPDGSYVGLYRGSYLAFSNSLNWTSITVLAPYPGIAPAIVTEPQSQSLGLGMPLNLSASAEGMQPLSFSWSHNGVVMVGATNSGFRLPSTSVPDAGEYFVTISNSYGGIVSRTVVVDFTNAPPVVIQQEAFAYTGAMGAARTWHTATLLPNGKVLVAGGAPDRNPNRDSGFLSSSELYDPIKGTWTATGTMATTHASHTATLLPNGKVLVAGTPYGRDQAFSAEIYEPATGTWSATGALLKTRFNHTATLLPNGKVLVAGGGDSNLSPLSSAELYDPATGTWAATGSMTTARLVHTATLLPDGTVLVAGGYSGNFPSGDPVMSAEIYDPATGTWKATGPMSAARYYHTATMLPNGKVLVAAGSSSSVYLSTAELYHPATGTWTETGALNDARHAHTATLLPNGTVLVAGGDCDTCPPGSVYETLSSAELYDPATERWTSTGALKTAREWQTATLLLQGNMLVAGGGRGIDTFALSSAELYTSSRTDSSQFSSAWRVAKTTQSNTELSIGTAVDNAGNVFVTGWFDGANDFGGTTLVSRGGQDGFVAKYSPSGKLQWVQQMGSAENAWETCRGAGVDSAGNVYVTGGFVGTASFGTAQLTARSSEGDCYVAKYSSAGVLQWVRQGGHASGHSYGTGLAVDAAGNAVVVGYFDGSTIAFDSLSADNVGYVNHSSATFLVRYDANGNGVWAKGLGGLTTITGGGDTYTTTVGLDAAGNCYVAGGFEDTLVLGGTNLVSTGQEAAYLAKFDHAGLLQWARQVKGAGRDGGRLGGVDGNGNSYVVGVFGKNVDFGGASLSTTSVSAMYLAKYDTSGTFQWARQADGTSSLSGFSDGGGAVDQQGNCYLPAICAGTMNFGTTNVTSLGGPSFGSDVLVAKYDSAGNCQWVATAGGTGDDAAIRLALDSSGNCYVAGWFQSTALFGTNTLQAQGFMDVFLAKLPQKSASSDLVSWEIHPVATNKATEVSMALASDGTDFLIGIQGVDSSSAAITAQLAGPDGAPIGPRLTTGRTGASFIDGPPVVVYGGNSYLMVWEDDGLGTLGGSNDIYGQIVHRDGTKSGGPISICQASARQRAPRAAFDGTNFLVIWNDDRNGPGEIFGQFLTPNGTLQGVNFPVAQESGNVREPGIAFDGINYLVVWMSRSASGTELWDVRGRTVSASGKLGTAFLISQNTSTKYNPLAVTFGGGGHLVVWNRNSGPSGAWDLYARFISSSGAPVGDEFAVTTAGGDQVFPSIDFDGIDYHLLWSDYASTGEIHLRGRSLAPNGQWASDEYTPFVIQGSNQPLVGAVACSKAQTGIVGTLGAIDFATKSFLNCDVFLAQSSPKPGLTMKFASGETNLTVLNGFLTMKLTGPENASVVLEASTDLANWVNTMTNTIPKGGLTITFPLATNSHTFYRARLGQ